ncbi:hypothetical protein AV530_005600 [Patagioenas fasciata monilis]|uniref:Uncharacterized protein n=1 Tax=Patagioenas fasciata monilis TaxID=372326 RepID=A0A1V4JLZ4_PATFA|nr:hypothetical protein AV530_005600 [Patagioenas fasciata monilis]
MEHNRKLFKAKKSLNAKLMAEQGMTLFQGELTSFRSQLTQENSLKPEAFQQVDELQCQVDDQEAAVSQRNVTAVFQVLQLRSKVTSIQHPLSMEITSSIL